LETPWYIIVNGKKLVKFQQIIVNRVYKVMNSILPNPFELFKKKENLENLENNETTDKSKEISSSNTNSDKKPKFFILPLTVAFSVLFGLSAFVYYLLNSFLYKQISKEMYTSNDFWKLFRSRIIENKFWIFFLLWVFVVIINTILLKDVFNIKESFNIFKQTTLYFAFIVGSTFCFIGLIPSFLESFENTLGYYIIKTFFGLKSTMKEVFKTRLFNQFNKENEEIEIPFDILITKFNIKEINDNFNNLPKENDTDIDFYLNPDLDENRKEELRKEILKLLFIKNSIGHFTWTFISSLATILATIITFI
jgi:hypothetical protein